MVAVYLYMKRNNYCRQKQTTDHKGQKGVKLEEIDPNGSARKLKSLNDTAAVIPWSRNSNQKITTAMAQRDNSQTNGIDLMDIAVQISS